MEREHWAELSEAVGRVAAGWSESRRYTHPTARVVRVHLWAALHDRPTSWACEPQNWGDGRARPCAAVGPAGPVDDEPPHPGQAVRAVHGGGGGRPSGGPPVVGGGQADGWQSAGGGGAQ